MRNLCVINYRGKALKERYPDAMSAEEKKAFADSEEALQKEFDPYREGDLLKLLNLLKKTAGFRGRSFRSRWLENDRHM